MFFALPVGVKGKPPVIHLPNRMRECRSIRGRQLVAAGWRMPRPARDRRWATRVEVELGAQFRHRWQRRFGILVRNLSTHGCGIADPGQLEVGTCSWIILPTLESRYARIAWCDGNGAGLEFADPLHKSVAEMIIARAAVASPGYPS